MALDEYRRKRDFTRSPEPEGGRAPRQKPRARFFCVQKHLASHLHYDFRLEHRGVLLSWAVPKGPSLDPSIKRLAMRVEDHPLEYGSFEGVIPEGYGAGIVMLWDRGTWTPEVDDVDPALAKGELKFTLDGYKLKGSWALVRTRGYGGHGADGRSWLLIKHRDEWSGNLNIGAFAPLSVKTGQDFAEILADDNPDLWRTNRPAGGETGALLREIVEQAAAIRRARAATPARRPRGTAAPARTRRATTRTTRAAAASSRRKSAGLPIGRKTKTGARKR
jgi:bifunctional non-homologous end joining protein LigD